MLEKLQVPLKSRGYDILIGDRLLAEAGAHISPLLKSNRVIIVSDEQAARFYLHRLTAALESKRIACRSLLIPRGEPGKSLSAFCRLAEQLLALKPDRDTTLIALGGGVVGDVTGFAASVLLRGIDFIQIPTTLLAQVDSSVGGKTGINSRFGKNLIGSFHQPRLVLADISALSTLPAREWRAGYAEVLKYGLMADAAFFAWLEKRGKEILAGKLKPLAEAVMRSCQAKIRIVAADEKEKNIRALLNFGHSFAHALEAETGYGKTLLHGEAVAIGMIMALRLSVAMKLCPKADLERALKHYEAVGLPDSPLAARKRWSVEQLMRHMEHDKKAKGGALTLILARGIGKAFIENNIDKSMVRAVLARACEAV